MKRLLVILLLIVNVAGTVIPCCPGDDCSNETSALNDRHPQEDNQDKGNCSPFFACGTCAHAIDIISPVSITLHEVPIQTTYCRFYLSALATYHPTLFQPPRLTC